MEHVGKTFLLDYGALTIRVRYLTASRLKWEQINGPDAGTSGEEEYGFAAVRPGLCFMWWQEKDRSVVTQVLDFEAQVVHTTWTSSDQKLAAFQGTVTPELPYRLR